MSYQDDYNKPLLDDGENIKASNYYNTTTYKYA